MQNSIKFVHTNLIAKDWKKLSNFYCEVFGCKPMYPERDLSGEWLEKITEIPDVKVRGVHLSLPGCENGPTVELFQYDPENPRNCEPSISRQGLGHIAFHVDNVEELLDRFIKHGGKLFGEVVKKQYPELGLLTVAYAKDPEGNFVEIQNWKR